MIENNSCKGAIKFTLLYQLPLGLLTSMILDGGMIFTYWSITMLAYFVSAFMIMKRKENSRTKTDLIYLKFSSLIILVITPFITRVVWTIKGINY